MICGLLVDRPGLNEFKKGGFGFELRPVGTLHLEGPRHRTKGGRERAARCVLEGFPGLEDWLFADDAGSVDLLGMTGSVHDRPMSVQQLNGRIAYIRNSDRIQKEPAAGGRIAVFRRETCADLDTNACSFRLGTRLEGFAFGHELDTSRRVRSSGSSHRQ